MFRIRCNFNADPPFYLNADQDPDPELREPNQCGSGSWSDNLYTESGIITWQNLVIYKDGRILWTAQHNMYKWRSSVADPDSLNVDLGSDLVKQNFNFGILDTKKYEERIKPTRKLFEAWAFLIFHNSFSLPGFVFRSAKPNRGSEAKSGYTHLKNIF